jgi:SPP1 gp7 family putative phage head morphogenesis protein
VAARGSRSVTIDFPDDPRGRELILMLERAKYDRWLSREITDLLSRTFNELIDTILSPAFRTLSQFEQGRKLQLFRALDTQIRSGYFAIRTTTLKQMQGYAELEAEIAQAQIRSVIPGAAPFELGVGAVITRQAVNAIAELPIQGLNIGEWFEAQAQGMSRETRRLIQNGLLQGKSIPEMVRQIVPPRSSMDTSLFRRARGDATSIVRTTVNAVQNYGAQRGYEAAGEDVTDSYRLLVVRDARTSAICRGLADRVFRYDDPRKMVPPFHISCRTTPIPIVKGASLSLSEQKTIPHTFGSYADWLRGQSASQQDSILGPTRASWWREGRLTIADAIDDDNRVLTLDQLRKRLPVKASAPSLAGAGAF